MLSVVAVSGCTGLLPRVQEAAVDAAADPWTWVPLAGAGAIALSGTDRQISDWARAETPLYGSGVAALRASDDFRDASSAGAWLTFAGARQRGGGDWLEAKGLDAAGAYAGITTAWYITGSLKQATQRPRPHGGPTYDSFPSAHSTGAFANATMARYYADGVSLGTPARSGIKWTTSALAAATAWARVEGGMHYPTDVLVGAAIANFGTRFMLQLTEPKGPRAWRFQTTSDGEAINIGLEKGF